MSDSVLKVGLLTNWIIRVDYLATASSSFAYQKCDSFIEGILSIIFIEGTLPCKPQLCKYSLNAIITKLTNSYKMLFMDT